MNKYLFLVLKQTNKKIFLAILFLLLLHIIMVSCDDINNLHQKFYDRGEDIYTGVVDSLEAYSGFERVKFNWVINADPRITKTVIYWNNRQDSVVVDVNRTQSGEIAMSYYLSDIEEGNYIFEFVTKDNEGHFSLPKEMVVLIFGESYAKTLKNRNIASIIKQSNGDMLITWDPVINLDIQYTTVKYEIDGIATSIRVENNEMETVLNGLNTGDKIGVSTTYLLENALDELHSPVKEYFMPKFEREINKANFNVVVLSGDNTSVNGGRDLSKIWDGKTASPGILHTIENASGFDFPHHFTFDMGVLAELSRFHIWPRTDVAPFTGHSPRYFEIWATNELKEAPDNQIYWESDEWKSDWELIGDYEITKPVVDEKEVWSSGWEYYVAETIGRVRYIRLIVKEPNWQGSNCVNIGEVTFWGDDL